MSTEPKALTRRDLLKRGCLALPLWGGAAGWASAAIVKTELPSIDLAFLASHVDLVERSKWTTMAPDPWRLRHGGEFDRVTVHHAGSIMDQAAPWERVRLCIEGILADHRARNFGDIGYHFLIDFDGRVWEGRSLAYEGAHTSGQNQRNVGVMLLGNFEEQEPTPTQIKGLHAFINVIRDHFRIKQHRIYGHRDLGQSLCPGERLYAEILKLRG